ncbi:OmpA family protein [Maridesulfovibrio sp.]|uniref:OmpA family protein n=1 Tax=Maridesulfovibrio sp. TaxID=2795000 RepID=UPI0029F4ADF0|nr:OmpA family protein [Maridesulfovibrio sp.]
MKKLVFLIIFVFCCASASFAEQEGFAATSDDILRMITDPGGRVFLQIEFKVNSAKISEKAYPVVNSLGQALTSSTGLNMQVKLVGHTDSAGDKDYNRTLSLKRAEAVKNYLAVYFNIDPGRVEVQGMGEAQPIASNENAQGRARNRRVEVINITTKTVSPTVPDAVQGVDTQKLW